MVDFEGDILSIKILNDINSEICKIDKPIEHLEEESISQDNNSRSTGCMGVFLMLIITSILYGWVIL